MRLLLYAFASRSRKWASVSHCQLQAIIAFLHGQRLEPDNKDWEKEVSCEPVSKVKLDSPL